MVIFSGLSLTSLMSNIKMGSSRLLSLLFASFKTEGVLYDGVGNSPSGDDGRRRLVSSGYFYLSWLLYYLTSYSSFAINLTSGTNSLVTILLPSSKFPPKSVDWSVTRFFGVISLEDAIDESYA